MLNEGTMQMSVTCDAESCILSSLAFASNLAQRLLTEECRETNTSHPTAAQRVRNQRTHVGCRFDLDLE